MTRKNLNTSTFYLLIFYCFISLSLGILDRSVIEKRELQRYNELDKKIEKLIVYARCEK